MLIISRFKDYYDSSVGLTGIDKTCIYDRNQFSEPTQYEFNQSYKKFEGDKIGWSTAPYISNYRASRKSSITDINISPFVIGFCGKTYVGYRIRIQSVKQNISVITYDTSQFLSHVPLVDNKYKTFSNGNYCIDKDDFNRLKSYYDKFDNKEHSELFVKNHVPCFVVDYGTGLLDISSIAPESYAIGRNNNYNIIYNPCLKNYEFYRIFGSGHAFQEIQMYLQGVLGTNEKIPTVPTDKEKIAQHGFDKFSFRKEPNKK